MNFGQAIEALKQGKRVARTGWNGKGIWLTYVSGWTPDKLFPYEAHPFIAMKTANGELVPWSATHADILAEDWELKY